MKNGCPHALANVLDEAGCISPYFVSHPAKYRYGETFSDFSSLSTRSAVSLNPGEDPILSGVLFRFISSKAVLDLFRFLKLGIPSIDRRDQTP